jgi:hypothetical protein
VNGYWKFIKGTHILPELIIVSDEAGHYMNAPAHNIPVDKYKGLLEEMGMKCCKYFRVKPGGFLERA